MPEPVTLPVYCYHCGGAVRLHLEDWPDSPSASDVSAQSWSCPYCRRSIDVTMPGRIVRATANYGKIKPSH
jgi:hypothetical protein